MASLSHPQDIVARLREMQRHVRAAVIGSRDRAGLAGVQRTSSADTIYGIDALIEPILEEYLEHWGQSLPMVVIAEGLEPETGRTFPAGAKEADCPVRLILDPVDGTRGLMYDKRAAWSLAGMAPNRGAVTRLRDIEVAVMTELPTAKMGRGDVLWAIKGQGAQAVREVFSSAGEVADSNPPTPLPIRPSSADTISHGFATVSNFFPGTKVLASELMEFLVRNLIGQADVTRATVFDDQYIRFNADLRPLFYRLQQQPEGLCCHPYDCCTALIAAEAGVILTDGRGQPLDGPLDTITGLCWAAFANPILLRQIEPLIIQFLKER